jgi:hypothetical protein
LEQIARFFLENNVKHFFVVKTISHLSQSRQFFYSFFGESKKILFTPGKVGLVLFVIAGQFRQLLSHYCLLSNR